MHDARASAGRWSGAPRMRWRAATDLESRALRVDLLSRVAPDQNAFELAIGGGTGCRRAGSATYGRAALTAAARIQRDAQLDPASSNSHSHSPRD